MLVGKYLNNNKGFTLIELLLAVSITGMVLVLSYSLYFNAIKVTDLGTERVKIEQELRLLDNILRKQIRDTGYLVIKNDSEEVITVGEEGGEDREISEILLDNSLTYNNRELTDIEDISNIKIKLIKEGVNKLILSFETYNMEKQILLNNLNDKDIIENEYQTEVNRDSVIYKGKLAELNYENKEGV